MIQEFIQQLHNAMDKKIRGMHTAIPGEIISFDTATCLATVAPKLIYKKPNGETMSFPQVTGVPVVFMQGANQKATVAFPVKAGDGCLIVVSEQSLDYWMYNQVTDTDLAFDLTNAICIPGLFVSPNAIVKEACEKNAVIVNVENSKISVKKDTVEVQAKTFKVRSEKVEIDSPVVTMSGDLSVKGTATAMNDVVGGGKSLKSHKHTAPKDGGETSAPN